MTATLTFSDDFNSLNLYSSATGKGTWDTTYWWADGANSKGNTLTSNGEQEWYINSDYAPTASVKPWTVNNGILNIQASPASSTISAQINGYKYTSGMLDTYHSFKQTYGYFEMRADLPAGKGLWPAFWLLPADGSWPPELDVMEVLGQDPTKLYTTVHSSTLAGGMESVNGGTTVANMSAGYHTYAVDWEPDHITWYFDNKAIYQVATPADMNKPMYVLMNLAVGGSWPGSPDSTTQFPANMQVDYVKAWSGNPYTAGVATPTAPSTTPTSSTPTTSTSTGSTSTGSSTGVASQPASAPSTTDSTGTSGTTSSTGVVLTSTHVGSVLAGGTGDDTLIASQGYDTLTGGAGHDVFVFKSEPWAPITIKDFQPGVDKLDLSALFKAAGYAGTDPVGDGYVYLQSDGSGGTIVRFDHDGHGGNPVWPNTIIDLKGIAPGSVTWNQLSGGASTVTGASSTSSSQPSTIPTTPSTTTTTPTGTSVTAGLNLSTSSPHVSLMGGAGADTLTAGPGYDTLTGGAGADHFVLKTEPWAPIKITDFHSGEDKLDLSALLKTAGYTGTNPVGDGYLYVQSDGAGGSIIRFDHDGHGPNPVWPNTIVDLVGVAPTAVKTSDWIIH